MFHFHICSKIISKYFFKEHLEIEICDKVVHKLKQGKDTSTADAGQSFLALIKNLFKFKQFFTIKNSTPTSFHSQALTSLLNALVIPTNLFIVSDDH